MGNLGARLEQGVEAVVNVIVHHRNVTPSQALEAHCRDRVARAVEPFAEQVDRVEVVLVDLNGARKGPGHACRVFLRLTGGGAVMFASKDRDFYRASSRAATGAGHRLARVLAKSRARTHQRFVPPLDAA
jgi:ribosome-associated translation inhibitor RaiA